MSRLPQFPPAPFFDFRAEPNNLATEGAEAAPLFTGLDLDREALRQQAKDLIEIAFPLVPPLLPAFEINVNNGKTEYLSVEIPEGKFIFWVGALGRISPEAFSVLNNHIDADIDDNDVQQIFEELLTGNSEGIGDQELVPGLEGFELIGLTQDSYSVAIQGNYAIDVITFEGPAVADLLAGLTRPLDLSDPWNQFDQIDLDVDSVEAGANDIDTVEEAKALLEAALDTSDDSVRLLGVEADNFSVVVEEQGGTAFDFLTLTGNTVSGAIADVASDKVRPFNTVDELTLADGSGNDIVGVGWRAFNGFGAPNLGFVITEDELPILLETAGQRPNVRALDQGGTVRLEVLGRDDTIDVIVFETDATLPNDAYDAGFNEVAVAEEAKALVKEFIRDPAGTLVQEALEVLSDLLNTVYSVPLLRTLIDIIAPERNVPDADPLTEEPVIDVANGVAEEASLEIPDAQFVFEIGSPFHVGTEGGLSLFSTKKRLPISELSGILRAEVDADADDNDAEQLLEEILNGRSGAVLDVETEPGIDGVELVALTPGSYTLAFQDGEVIDLLTLEGAGVEAILEAFDARTEPAHLADGENNISLIDLGTDTIELGTGAENPILDIVGDAIDDDTELEALFQAARDGTSDAVTLLNEESESITLLISNAATAEFDYLVFFDPTDVSTVI